MDNRKLVLLLAVPAAAMKCRARANRAAWFEGFAAEGMQGHHGRAFGPGRFGPSRFGPRAGFGQGPWTRDAAWHLPPFIEAKLDEWHRAAHEAGTAATESVPTEGA